MATVYLYHLVPNHHNTFTTYHNNNFGIVNVHVIHSNLYYHVIIADAVVLSIIYPNWPNSDWIKFSIIVSSVITIFFTLVLKWRKLYGVGIVIQIDGFCSTVAMQCARKSICPTAAFLDGAWQLRFATTFNSLQKIRKYNEIGPKHGHWNFVPCLPTILRNIKFWKSWFISSSPQQNLKACMFDMTKCSIICWWQTFNFRRIFLISEQAKSHRRLLLFHTKLTEN